MHSYLFSLICDLLFATYILSVKLFEDYLAGKNIKGQLKPSINLLSYQEEAMIINFCFIRHKNEFR